MHLLMILKNEWKPRTASEIDHIVCVELPDPEEDPELFEIISSVQMHRPCGIYNP
ncbi:Protein CBG06768, partial [Caenorhabditis briggsae]